jgi:hypothetical protein
MIVNNCDDEMEMMIANNNNNNVVDILLYDMYVLSLLFTVELRL